MCKNIKDRSIRGNESIKFQSDESVTFLFRSGLVHLHSSIVGDPLFKFCYTCNN